MNAINRAAGSIFDVLLTPFELLGDELSLILVSGLFGILALLIFKRISWQAGIKKTKDKIKGHMIAIRLYQDDLVIVGKSVGKVLLKNFQYLGLNFGPILPLFIPFILVAAQFVVRYGFDPLPVMDAQSVTTVKPGKGTMIEVSMKRGSFDQVADLTMRYPQGIVPVTRLVRSVSDGKAFQEVVATRSVAGEIELLVGGQPVGTKKIVAGDAPTRLMQPERVSSFWLAWMWPAEARLDGSSPLERVYFAYPERDLAFLPGGPFGILVVFFLASIAFGLLVMKPLNIQI